VSDKRTAPLDGQKFPLGFPIPYSLTRAAPSAADRSQSYLPELLIEEKRERPAEATPQKRPEISAYTIAALPH